VSNSSPTLTGKTCIVTGATSGIGRAATLRFAALGANVILVGRNQRAAQTLLNRLRAESPEAAFDFIAADLSCQRDVHRLAAWIGRGWHEVDVLVNNAGARFDSYREGPDGIELTFATNHLGHFLLTNLLMDRLVRAPAARIITVTSGSHYSANAAGQWFQGGDRYDRRLAYANSKLANLMFAYELADRLRKTRVPSNAVDPGGIASNFARNNGVIPWAKHLVAHALRRDLATSRAGAATVVYLASSPEAAGVTGRLFRRNRPIESSPASLDRAASARLWELSEYLTGLSGPVTQARTC